MRYPDRLTLIDSPETNQLQEMLTAFLYDRESSRCTTSTLSYYSNSINKFIAFILHQFPTVKTVEDVNATHIRGYFISMQARGLKDTSQHDYARAIRAWFNWLVFEEILERSPMAKVKMPKVAKKVLPAFTPEEIARLLAACNRKTVMGRRDYAIILCLLDSGLRIREFASLRVGDVDMKTGIVSVIGKGEKQRQVRLGAKSRSAISLMLSSRGNARVGDPLWIGYNPLTEQSAGALSIAGIQSLIRRLGKQANVNPCRPHKFRRTFALWCLRDGMNIYDLKNLMGHSDLSVLQKYLCLACEDVERAHQAHSPVDRLLK